jgi:hypothetical protein
MDLALYHPPVSRFSRDETGIGCAQFLPSRGRMLNPARAASQVIGFVASALLRKDGRGLAHAELSARAGDSRRRGRSGTIDREFDASVGAQGRAHHAIHIPAEGCGLTMATFREMAGFPVEQREREADLIKRSSPTRYRAGNGIGSSSMRPCCSMQPAKGRRLLEILLQPEARWSQVRPKPSWLNWWRSPDQMREPRRRSACQRKRKTVNHETSASTRRSKCLYSSRSL